MKRGLLIAAHGSRNPSWNQRVVDAAESLSQRSDLQAHYRGGVRAAFLEGAGESLATGVRDLRQRGAERIHVIPFFLTASGHLEEDLPVVLGIRSDPEVAAELAEEGIEVLPLDSNLRLAPPMNRRAMLGANVVRRASAISTAPSEESIVLTYYGSSKYGHRWDEMLAEVGSYLRDEAGYASVAGAPVGHWVKEGPAALTRVVRQELQSARRVLVVPLLVSVGFYQQTHIPNALEALSTEERERTAFEPTAILPCPEVESMVTELALDDSAWA